MTSQSEKKTSHLDSNKMNLQV